MNEENSSTEAPTRATLRTYAALHVMIALYSLGSVCSKLASGHPFMSLPFLLFYGGSIAILGIYAIGWQQIIKHLPLTAAYANKAVTLVWGLVWGRVIFGEGFTAQKVLGAGIVLAGVVLFALSDNTSSAGSSSSDPQVGAGASAGDASREEA